jgi:palmitoyltransferase ZDHHC6
MMVRRVYLNLTVNYWDSVPAVEFVFILLNFVTCIPVLLSVGAFSIYHFNALMNNTTTIEGWEKDKVATMVRRGKIREVKFPYNLGRRRNIESVMGIDPFLWCWPTRTPGNGLRYELSEGEELEDDEDRVWPPDDPTRPYFEEAAGEFKLPDSPWTFENGDVNPDLQPYNIERRQASITHRRKKRNGYSSLPPYHPDYQGSGAESEGESIESSEDGDYHSNGRPRRGSEGIEIKPVDRDEMLRRYLAEIGETPGRYHRYIPQVESESENEEDSIPLSQAKLHT